MAISIVPISNTGSRGPCPAPVLYEDGNQYCDPNTTGCSWGINCKGEQHIYTIDIPNVGGPFKYEWKWLGNVSYDPYVIVTFPVNPPYNFKLEFKITPISNECSGWLGNVYLGTSDCGPQFCITKCSKQIVDIPGTRFINLIDTSGNVYPFPSGIYTTCTGNSVENQGFKTAIRDMLEAALPCNIPDYFEIKLYNNYVQPNCLRLVLKNTPIKLKAITSNDGEHLFDCTQ